MKMVKSLLLGSAAGVVAIAGAQAADLPVKAKPVQYVKICSLYGAGFYYIPGTDTCIKLGGFVRAEYNFYANGSFNPNVRNLFAHNRTSNENNIRTRGLITVDARSQTEYGTLRSYLSLAATVTNGNGGANAGLYAHRAFIQLAGFTAGLSVSFFDFFSFSSVSNQTAVIGSETGGGGQLLFAYTAQLGNGLSASISAEDPSQRRGRIYDFATTSSFNGGGKFIGFNGWPDVVANLRVDQSWGSAQIMGALHQVASTYWTGPVAGTVAINPGTVEGNGHPGDEVGFAIGGGLKFNLPMLGNGDWVGMQVAYAKGAMGYIQGPAGGVGANIGWFDGSTVGQGIVADAVMDSGVANAGVLGGLELTEGWEVGAGYEHHWNSMWKTSLYGGYMEFNFNGTAERWFTNVFPANTGGPDWSFWQVGSRTVWTPVKNLDLSVDVMYSHLDTGFQGSAVGNFGAAAKNAGPYTMDDQDLVSFMFRAQRNFYP
jgi:hypothetical protein